MSRGGERAAAKSHAASELRRFPGVAAVAWGQPRRAGVWDARPALVAHVQAKCDPARKSDWIPPAIDGYATDVLEVGRSVTVSGVFDHSDRVLAATSAGRTRISTPTLLQRAGDRFMALVSGHGTLPLLAGAFATPSGDPVRLDDPSFGSLDGALVRGAIGRGLDFALAEFASADADIWTGWHLVAGPPPITRRATALSPGERLYHYSILNGRRTRIAGTYRQDVLDDVELEDAFAGLVNLGALLFVESFDVHWPFALPGDSGSLVVDAQGRAVGVIVGSTADRRFAYVMTFGNLGLVLSAEELGWFLQGGA
jgi:hypothetical protein